MSDDSEQNKSEDATSYKLQQARKKGTVARGSDLGFLTAMAAFTGYIWINGEALVGKVAGAGRDALVAAPQVLTGSNEIMAVSGGVLVQAVRPLALLAVTVFAVVLVFEMIQTGMVFSAGPLRPDFGRLNPGKGLKRVFSFRILVETAKSVLKLICYAAVAFMVIKGAVTTQAVAITDAASLTEVMRAGALRLLGFFVLIALAFAAFDQIVSRRDFSKKMRMSRREVKREHRDREGDARIKAKRKQLHGEFAKTSLSLRGLKGADVLVVNPTHYAVALKYDPARMAAPVVVSKGQNQVALRLKRLAFVYGVVVVQDAPLARALHASTALQGEVAESFFPRIASIYRAMRAKDQKEQSAHAVA